MRDSAKPNLTQMEVEDSPNNPSVFSLSFKSATGQPLVIDSTPGPQYIFNHLVPTREGAAA